MDDRKLQILGAIVEDYVSTREPVGSKSLLERHELGVSAATVRNDMSVLEEEGLIHQPHTSAGRVPTDKGYRAFVDHVAMVKPLSAAEKRAIRTLLEDAGDVEELLARTVRLLAQLTQQVADLAGLAGLCFLPRKFAFCGSLAAELFLLALPKALPSLRRRARFFCP